MGKGCASAYLTPRLYARAKELLTVVFKWERKPSGFSKRDLASTMADLLLGVKR